MSCRTFLHTSTAHVLRDIRRGVTYDERPEEDRRPFGTVSGHEYKIEKDATVKKYPRDN